MEIEDATEVECTVCLTGVHPDNALIVSHSGDIVCEYCARICEHCEEVLTENDNFSTVDGERWCESCTDADANWCDSCEEFTCESTYYIQDRGSSWCNTCADDRAVWCEECDEYYESGCTECNSSRVIHDYSYRPDPIFHSTDKNERLFFGLEIEMETRNLADSAEYAYQLEGLELAYLKYDGSLSRGFELVTHPMSHDFIKNEAHDLFRVLTGLREQYKVASWSTSTCGLHIHISRTGFNGGAHMHRFLNLVYSNQVLFETLAGRSSTRWAKFDDVDVMDYLRDSNGVRVTDEEGYNIFTKRRSFKHKIEYGRQSDRYSAVNTQNGATLEMRIFKGTTKPSAIKSHVDLAHASVEYTRNLSVKQVREGALDTDLFMAYIESHADLYPELNERMARLIDTSVRLAEQNVSA